MTFKSEWEKQTTLVIKASNQMVRATAIDMFGYIIELTPVGNVSLWKTDYPPKNYTGGSLRANWQLTLGQPASGTLEEKDDSKDGAPTKAKVNREIAKYKNGGMYLTNNLPYAERVARGWSTQQPNGWIERVVMGFQRSVDKAARENKLP